MRLWVASPKCVSPYRKFGLGLFLERYNLLSNKNNVLMNNFCGKNLQLEIIVVYLRSQTRGKFIWWIHLRARIRASHARHRGSNPLSTTQTDNFGCLFFFVLWLMMQTIRLAAYTCLALFAFASELAGNYLKPQPAV